MMVMSNLNDLDRSIMKPCAQLQSSAPSILSSSVRKISEKVPVSSSVLAKNPLSVLLGILFRYAIYSVVFFLRALKSLLKPAAVYGT